MMKASEISYQSFENITDPQQLGLLAEAIIMCINSAFGREMPSDEIDEAMVGPFIAVALSEAQEVVGFASLHYFSAEESQHYSLILEDYDSTYSFGAGTVSKEFQGQGIYQELNRLRIQYIVDRALPHVETTTQNPRVEKGIKNILDEFVTKGVLLKYELKRIKLPGFYGQRLTSYAIETSNTDFDQLDIDAGDAFSLFFTLEYPSIHTTNA